MTNPKEQVVSHNSKPNYFDLIHVDLHIKILSKLSAKPMAKCRCVWKLWSSIIRSHNYNQLFPIKLPATPRLLFAVEFRGKLLFESAPQPRNPSESSSHVSTHHQLYSDTRLEQIGSNVGGFVCSRYVRNYYSWAVITNPITGQSLSTPEVKSSWTRMGTYSRFYFGYDPIEKQFKVLCMSSTWSPNGDKYPTEYQVLTLWTGTGSLQWRKLQCSIPRNNLTDHEGICINGVLYVKEYAPKIFCFDVKSEKFSFINMDQDLGGYWKWDRVRLIDYNGKLGAFLYDSDYHSFKLWVLEDVEWSTHSYAIPVMSGPCLDSTYSVHSAGMIGSDEIVLYQIRPTDTFYIFCYNLKRNIIRSVSFKFPALELDEYDVVHPFLNFVEDVKLM